MGILFSDGKIICTHCNQDIIEDNKIKYIQFGNNVELMCENCFNKEYNIEKKKKYTKYNRFEIMDI